MQNRRTFSLFKFLTTFFVCIVIALTFIVKPKAALVLSFLLMLGIIGWMLARRLEIKNFVLGFFFIYPLLPLLWGFQIASFLPVIRAHRVSVLILIFFLINKGVFIQYYKDFFKTNIFSYVIIFLTISLFLSSLFSIAKVPSFFYFFSFIFEILIISITVFCTFKTNSEIEDLLKIMCFSTILLAVFGVLEKVSGSNIFSTFGAFNKQVMFLLATKFREGGIRIEGPFAHPIAFGAFFSMSLPYVLRRYKGQLLKFTFAIGIILFALFSTQSRSAQIGALIVLFYFFFFVEKKTLGVLFFFSIPVIFIFIDPILDVLATLDPTGSAREDLASSSSARTEQFDFLFPFIKQRFAIGFGRIDVPALMRSPNLYANSVDNWYLLYTFFYGLMGFFSWGFLMIMSIAKPIYYYGKDFLKDNYIPYILISIIVFCLTNTVVSLVSFHYIFWINLGLLVRLIVNKRVENNVKHNNS